MNREVFVGQLNEVLMTLNRAYSIRSMTNSFWVDFYNVPVNNKDRTDRENNRIALEFIFTPDNRLKVTQHVNMLGENFKLRAKTGQANAVLKYALAFLRRCSESK